MSLTGGVAERFRCGANAVTGCVGCFWNQTRASVAPARATFAAWPWYFSCPAMDLAEVSTIMSPASMIRKTRDIPTTASRLVTPRSLLCAGVSVGAGGFMGLSRARPRVAAWPVTADTFDRGVSRHVRTWVPGDRNSTAARTSLEGDGALSTDYPLVTEASKSALLVDNVSPGPEDPSPMKRAESSELPQGE